MTSKVERTVGLKTPFNMMIVGMTACGKTHYLLSMLEEHYMNHFEHIVLLCPTFEWNKTYVEWAYLHDEDFVALQCSQDDIDSVLNYVIDTYKGTNTLIILDDCACGKEIKNRTSEVVKLGFSARHYGISTIVITQQLTSVSRPFRLNVSKVAVFYNASRKDMKELSNEYMGDVSQSELNEITKSLKDNKYSRLEILLIHPYTRAIVVPR